MDIAAYGFVPGGPLPGAVEDAFALPPIDMVSPPLSSSSSSHLLVRRLTIGGLSVGVPPPNLFSRHSHRCRRAPPLVWAWACHLRRRRRSSDSSGTRVCRTTATPASCTQKSTHLPAASPSPIFLLTHPFITLSTNTQESAAAADNDGGGAAVQFQGVRPRAFPAAEVGLPAKEGRHRGRAPILQQRADPTYPYSHKGQPLLEI